MHRDNLLDVTTIDKQATALSSGLLAPTDGMAGSVSEHLLEKHVLITVDDQVLTTWPLRKLIA
jgi:hypothetical protein